MKIVISRLELQAALLFASQDDTRFTLCGVCVEVAPNKKPTIISTDGRRLAVIQAQAIQEEDFKEKFEMLLRTDFVKPICALSKALGGKLFPWIAFESNAGSKRIKVDLIGGNCRLEAEENALIEGSFPKWRACIPNKTFKRTQINDLGINAEFVGDFAKAAKIFKVDKVIQMNLVGKDSAVEVKIPRADYFYGLVMPCKTDESVDYQPEFLGIIENLPTKEPAEKESAAANEEEDINVTISSGNTEVKMTGKQLSAAAKKISKKSF